MSPLPKRRVHHSSEARARLMAGWRLEWSNCDTQQCWDELIDIWNVAEFRGWLRCKQGTSTQGTRTEGEAVASVAFDVGTSFRFEGCHGCIPGPNARFKQGSTWEFSGRQLG